MRRKAPEAGAEAEACGVWLDTAALKRRPVQAVLSSVAVTRLVARRATTGLGREAPARVPKARMPSAGHRQTHIASFFPVKPAGQTVGGGSVSARRGAEAKRPTAQSPRPHPPSPRERRTPPPGVRAAVRSPVLPREPTASPAPAGQRLRGPLQPPPRCFVPPREEDSLACAFTQDSEGYRVLAHGRTEAGGSPPRGGAGRRSPGPSVAGCGRLFAEDSQGCGVTARRRPFRETTNLQGGSPGPPPAPRSLSLGSQAALLFSQDSQGNRVIKHRLG
ncbi:aurora kinase A and ninein-interacting protein [Ornithorhynchus anatinus]|uniref:aurora kinase A and ninein-interacting protein n=1 Tax=Ornithorhynchus anatinus TaxID=9258 RepID=UPI0010A916A9|nr:aurora kinase A and ninein-interacting protein [Ornithorhynchus anatinus]